MDWSPKQYLKFADERSRPARELLMRVPISAPELIYDLGSGPGNSTAVLAERYTSSEIVGVDNSDAMLADARRALPGRQFLLADLRHWKPDRPANLLFSNATFQWLPDHLSIMSRLVSGLPPGGVFAVQMPDNLDEPSHSMMREAAHDDRWSDALAGAASARETISSPEVYYDLLKPFCASVDIWHTHYQHVLGGTAGIVAWLKSTGLRPFLAPLDEVRRALYLADYEKRLESVYRPRVDGKVLLNFPRLFIVAVKR